MLRRRKKTEHIENIPLSDIVYCSGSRMYVGADDVFLVVLALIFARTVIEKIPAKKQTPHLSVLYKRWGDLLSQNAEWMEKMEKVNCS